VPVWESYAPGLFSDTGPDGLMLLRVIVLATALGLLLALSFAFLFRRKNP
jgi:ABC-type phosphate/phosphonate transport system permease subunit